MEPRIHRSVLHQQINLLSSLSRLAAFEADRVTTAHAVVPLSKKIRATFDSVSWLSIHLLNSIDGKSLETERVLKKLIGFAKQQDRIMMMTELSLLYAKENSIEQAYDYLYAQLSHHEYLKAVPLHGLCGIFAYVLFTAATTEKTQREWTNAATERFRAVSALDPDSFVWVHFWSLLIEQRGEIRDSKRLVKAFVTSHPHDLLAVRYYCRLRIARQASPDKILPLIENWFRLDPFSHEAFHTLLAFMFKAKEKVSASKLFHVICDRLDAFSRSSFAWSCLLWLLLHGNQSSRRGEWAESRKWMCELHFGLRDIAKLSDALIVSRSLVALLLYPVSSTDPAAQDPTVFSSSLYASSACEVLYTRGNQHAVSILSRYFPLQIHVPILALNTEFIVEFHRFEIGILAREPEEDFGVLLRDRVDFDS